MAEITMQARLRAIADWLDANPAAEPSSIAVYSDDARILDFALDAQSLARRALSIGGRWAKGGTDDHFWLRQEILPGVIYELCSHREAVCERVVVGTEMVTEPAPDAPMVEVEREIVEYRCPPSLLSIGGAS
ncbi:MAG TPA: hypothetical protein VFF79_12640 [Conexibacter sp.]|jgi:hypothetical protein|nr:hypothetical protein [Conexibacter sp.]